jgi:F-type H+-transporting ATPase subunit b
MPQLNVEMFPSQIFWLIVTFAFLYLLLSRSILPRIHAALENRQSKINHDIDRAEQLRNEAEEARETYERALKESRLKAQDLIAESSALMDKSAAARHAELDKKLEKQLADAEANITSAKAEALAKLAPVSKELTQQIVEKLTGKKLQASEVSSVVDSLIEEKAHV